MTLCPSVLNRDDHDHGGDGGDNLTGVAKPPTCGTVPFTRLHHDGDALAQSTSHWVAWHERQTCAPAGIGHSTFFEFFFFLHSTSDSHIR